MHIIPICSNLNKTETGQFLDLDVYHRPRNAHDSNGGDQLMMTCFANANEMFKISMFESRIDSSLFNKKLLAIFDNGSVKSNASIQYARIVQLKDMSEKRKRWQSVDKEWSYFETTWKSKSYNNSYLFIFSRKKVKKQYIVYSQLHLFEPCEFDLDYKVIVTNKTEPVRRDLLHFLEKFLSRAFFFDKEIVKKSTVRRLEHCEHETGF